jgi:GntR family transcriptional regulator, transcriptional repressor for pyruvate dehydrogenase complex
VIRESWSHGDVSIDPEEEGAGPAYKQVAARLRALILSGELVPADRLPSEAELSALFKVSRSTTREALRLLSSENLIVTSRGPTGGSFVAHPEPGHIQDFLQLNLGLLAAGSPVTVRALFEARELLETPAAGMAATRRTPEQLEMLRACVRPAEGDDDPGQLFEMNRAFHVQLLEAADNVVLMTLAQPVFGVIRGRFGRNEADEAFWGRVVSDHEVILAAVEAGDADRAQAAMRRHIAHLETAYSGMEQRRAEEPQGD